MQTRIFIVIPLQIALCQRKSISINDVMGSGNADYSVKTTDCRPEISKRLRQRMFLQAIRSSLRNM